MAILEIKNITETIFISFAENQRAKFTLVD